MKQQQLSGQACTEQLAVSGLADLKQQDVGLVSSYARIMASEHQICSAAGLPTAP